MDLVLAWLHARSMPFTFHVHRGNVCRGCTLCWYRFRYYQVVVGIYAPGRKSRHGLAIADVKVRDIVNHREWRGFTCS
jgi:hypothetical protein